MAKYWLRLYVNRPPAPESLTLLEVKPYTCPPSSKRGTFVSSCLLVCACTCKRLNATSNATAGSVRNIFRIRLLRIGIDKANQSGAIQVPVDLHHYFGVSFC